MKYRIRRLVAGVIATPVIAGVYFVGYVMLVGLGATPNATPIEVWNNGLWLGAFMTVCFVFARLGDAK